MVLYKIGEVVGCWYNSFIEYLAENIFYYMETPLFNNKINQLVFNKYAEILMWLGSIAVIISFGVNQVLFGIGFFAPAIVANTVPPIGKKIVVHFQSSKTNLLWLLKALYNEPMNLERFGSHKTWGGFILGVALGALSYPLIDLVIVLINNALHLTIATYDNFILGLALAIAALTGDAIGSFLKRRKGILPGEFVPMDLYGWSWAALIVSIISVEFWKTPELLSGIALTILPVGSSISGIIAVVLKIKEGR